MSLIGSYVNIAQNYRLDVTAANDANGQGAGVMHWGPHAIPVTIHYHFENNVGPITNLNIWGALDNPNKYLTASGSTSNQGYNEIQIGISLATDARVDTFRTILARI